MNLTPFVLTSLLTLTTATTPVASTCEQFLACGEYQARAQRIHSTLTADWFDETFEIKDVAPGNLRITERSVSHLTKREITTNWDLTFAADGTFRLHQLAEGPVPERHGTGSCVERRCTFTINPDQELSSGSLTVSAEGLDYVVTSFDAETKRWATRYAFTRRPVAPAKP